MLCIFKLVASGSIYVYLLTSFVKSDFGWRMGSFQFRERKNSAFSPFESEKNSVPCLQSRVHCTVIGTDSEKVAKKSKCHFIQSMYIFISTFFKVLEKVDFSLKTV